MSLSLASLNAADAASPVWVEAESFASVTGNADRAVVGKPPASGGQSTAGTCFISAGDAMTFDLDLERAIPEAKLVLRYARLHFRDSMAPARLKVKVTQGASTSTMELICGDTQGWGTRNAKEWAFLEASLGKGLKPGPVSVEFSVAEDSSNVNLDGFFLAPEDFSILREETRELQRIRIMDQGYVGLNLGGDTVFPGAFEGFSLVGRGFGGSKLGFEITLVGADGEVTAIDEVMLSMGSKPAAVDFDAHVFDAAPDGIYILKIASEDATVVLTHPISIMRELIEQARAKADEFRAVVKTFREASNWRSGIHQTQWELIPDLEHAIEFIDKIILVLEARQRGEVTASARVEALVYFERSPTRTAADFAEDIRNIIEQTETSLARAAEGTPAYKDRYGDIRRAFYSTSTGALEPYRIYVPEASKGMDSIPLLVMLHGGGGDENYFPDLDGGDVLEVLDRRPCIMLSPKATSWYWGPGAVDLKQMIDATVALYPNIDPERIYCTGVSAGGGGSFRMALTYPGLFRAIAPVSSGPQINDQVVETLDGLPMLIIQGGQDVVADPERAILADKALTERGYPHKMVLFPEYGHEYHGKEYLELTLDYFEEML